MLVSVSFLKNKKGDLEAIQEINKSQADYIHVDVMDGKLVKEKNFTFQEIKDLFKGITKPLDIHLMTINHLEYAKELQELHPEYITIHVETNNIKETIKFLKNNNIKVGLAINPKTPVFKLLPYLKDIDLILIMSVEPGAGGQEFISSTTKRINELKVLQKKYNYLISVDGGVNNETIKYINSDIVVSGSYICLSDNYNEKIQSLKN